MCVSSFDLVQSMKARQIGGVVWPLVLLRDSKNVILRPIHKRLLEVIHLAVASYWRLIVL